MGFIHWTMNTMNDALSEHRVVRELADHVARRMTRKVIPELQCMRTTLSGDDSEIRTVWDEVCTQVQRERSVFLRCLR